MHFYKKTAPAAFISLLLACTAVNAQMQPATAAVWSAEQRIFVHTDKTEYLAGELLWFKTYLVDAATNKPAGRENIVYVELLNSKGKAVQQAKISTDRTRRDGCFYLPADLSTGTYLLTAYTTEMKSAGPRVYFRKKINVVNTFKPLPAANTVQKANAVFSGFYPEGGNVIPGMPARFGFYIMNPSTRKGLNAKGILVNQKGDTITNFQTLKFGMGQLSFTPNENERYTAFIQPEDDSIVKKELMLPVNNGYSLSLLDINGRQLKMIIAYKASTQSRGRQKVKLLIHSRETIRSATEIELESGESKDFVLNHADLNNGVNYFTLFNSDGQPVCERLYFVPPAKPSAGINIALSNITPGKRDSLNIGLDPSGADGNETLNGSLAVIPLAAETSSKTSSIYEYLLLGADLPGEVEEPRFYFSEQARTNPAYLENLMLVNGWRRFSSDINPGKLLVTPMPEYNGHVVTARVSDNWTKSPRAGVFCSLTTPSSPFGFYTGVSDSSGIVRFSVLNYLGPGTIVLKANSTIKPNPYRIEIINPFDERLMTDSTWPLLNVSPADSSSLAFRSFAMQTMNTYQHDEINRFIAPVLADTFPFFGKPEYSYYLDKYTRFSTMEEVLREYVTPITVAMRGSRPAMSIYNEKLKVMYPDFMLVLLDGVPLSDPHQIFNYDPYKVKKIDIVPRRYLYGANQYYGIASFETYTGQFDAVDLDPSSLLVDYEGIQLKREFYSPVYTNEDKGDPRVPDLRTTLLWLPNVDLGGGESKTVRAYTSDFTGSFKVVFCGVTSSGRPVQDEKTFTVK